MSQRLYLHGWWCRPFCIFCRLVSRVGFVLVIMWDCRHCFPRLLLFPIKRKNPNNTFTFLYKLERLTGADLHTDFFFWVSNVILAALWAELKMLRLTNPPHRACNTIFFTVTTKNNGLKPNIEIVTDGKYCWQMVQCRLRSKGYHLEHKYIIYLTTC